MIAREMLHVVVRMRSRNAWRDQSDAISLGAGARRDRVEGGV